MTHPNHSTRSRTTRPLIAASALAALLGLTVAANQDADVVENTIELVKERREIQRMIWEEKREWELSREALTGQIELRKSEIESLRAKIAKDEGEIGEADAEIAKLVESDETTKAVSADLLSRIGPLEARLMELVGRLPEPLVEQVRPVLQQIPNDPENTKQSLATRYTNVAFVLGKIASFNSEIRMESETRTLDDGSSASVATFYVGIGKAFYANEDGTQAGIGSAGEDAWTWKSANDAGPDILKAIKILENEEIASFVQLPLEID